MIIKHVEIIIPPGAEYFLLQERLQSSILNEGMILYVVVGVFIPIPQGNMRDQIKTIDSNFKELGTKDYGNN